MRTANIAFCDFPPTIELPTPVGTPGMNSRDFGNDPDPADLPQPHVVLYDLTTGKPVETLAVPVGHPRPCDVQPGRQDVGRR